MKLLDLVWFINWSGRWGGDVPPWPLPPVATPLVHPMSWIVWSHVCLYNTILSPQNTHVYAILTQIVPKYRDCKVCFMFVLMKTPDNISIARTFVLWRKLLPCSFSPHLKGPPPYELTYFLRMTGLQINKPNKYVSVHSYIHINMTRANLPSATYQKSLNLPEYCFQLLWIKRKMFDNFS